MTLAEWMETVTGPDWTWFVKFLSGNDTLANGTHQAGPYLPRAMLFDLFPSLHSVVEDNPRVRFEASIDSHGYFATPQAIWYNNRLRGGTRNECRLTGWGGSASPLLDPDATGSLCVFAFERERGADAKWCRVWLCRDETEEDAVVEIVGVIDPGVVSVHSPTSAVLTRTVTDSDCVLGPAEFPADWRYRFPDAEALVEFAIKRIPSAVQHPPDKRLIRRRNCEFELFRSVEETIVLPRIREGFATIDIFVEFANTVTNRRKARSGRSLEWHTRRIFDEEKLGYSHGAVSEGGKRPDFLFPSAEAYWDASYPTERLQMLAVKTTCKERWRQVLEEADRIPTKRLLTLQEGVSPGQFQQMADAGIVLVVPAPLHEAYGTAIRPSLVTLEAFINETKAKCS